tara:strand:- start:430 stop:1005 length:576 start_codon:yes stop_codon:yes gene_type:complete
MKKFFQLALFSFLIIIGIFFYNNYFKSNKLVKKIDKIKKDQVLIDGQNNLIKNLKYKVKFENDSQYIITANSGELIYEQEIEIVKMNKVVAKFTDENNISLKIKSDNANYDNFYYNTKFFNNVEIEYLDNIINSDNLDLIFTDNIVKIYNNVVYEGLQGSAKADNVKIDLNTKRIEIFMNNTDNKVEVLSK